MTAKPQASDPHYTGRVSSPTRDMRIGRIEMRSDLLLVVDRLTTGVLPGIPVRRR